MRAVFRNAARVTSLLAGGMSDGLLILGWHNAQPTPFYPSSPGVAARGLWHQLKLVRAAGNVVALESAIADLAEGRPLPPRAVALTFDDGYNDNLETVVPMLRRLELPATFFLVTGLLDRAVGPWWETLAWAIASARHTAVEWRNRRLVAGRDKHAYKTMLGLAEQLKACDANERWQAIDEVIELLEPRGSKADIGELFLDWEGARRLAAEQSIGSHTSFHNILSAETAEAQRHDLDESRRRLESELERPVKTLAYPNGTARDYGDATLAAAEHAGYAAAVTTIEGRNRATTPRLELRRFVIDPARGVPGHGDRHASQRLHAGAEELMAPGHGRSVSVIEDLAQLARLTGEWDELAVRAGRPLAAPGWLLAWWRNMAPAGARLRTVAVHDGDRLVGLAPFFATRVRTVVIYRPLGSAMAIRGTLLADAGREQEVARAVADALAEASPRPAAIHLDQLDVGSPWPGLLAARWPGARARARPAAAPLPRRRCTCARTPMPTGCAARAATSASASAATRASWRSGERRRGWRGRRRSSSGRSPCSATCTATGGASSRR